MLSHEQVNLPAPILISQADYSVVEVYIGIVVLCGGVHWDQNKQQFARKKSGIDRSTTCIYVPDSKRTRRSLFLSSEFFSFTGLCSCGIVTIQVCLEHYVWSTLTRSASLQLVTHWFVLIFLEPTVLGSSNSKYCNQITIWPGLGPNHEAAGVQNPAHIQI